MNGRPRDDPRALGLLMGLGCVVAFALFAGVALDMWPNATARFEPRVVSRMATSGAFELVVHRNRSGHYVVQGSVNRVGGEFLRDTGASKVAIPPALVRRFKLT